VVNDSEKWLAYVANDEPDHIPICEKPPSDPDTLRTAWEANL
jgi:hypothetical protein